MNKHRSVLRQEAIQALNIKSGKTYIDATLNGGGHTKEILKLGGKVFGLDIDPKAVEEVAKEFQLKFEKNGGFTDRGNQIIVTQGNFANIKTISEKYGIWETPGILFDLGLSSNQLEDAQRGFSFSKEGPLDMRMDPSLNVTAEDLINNLNEGELNDLFSRFGEEHFSRRIARAIRQSRVEKRIKTTEQLAELIGSVVKNRGKIHPATRVFQALRIIINDELKNLEKGLRGAVDILEKHGRLVVISFHSLEDRIVKDFFRNEACLNILTKKPLTPTNEEINQNPRSRSAKMRIVEKN